MFGKFNVLIQNFQSMEFLKGVGGVDHFHACNGALIDDACA